MTKLADGLVYRKLRYHDSDCHVLEVDMTIRTIGSSPIGPTYPYRNWIEDDNRPPVLAAKDGALASTSPDYGATRYAGVPLTSQPIGAYMKDGELWTSGQRNEGKFLSRPGAAKITQTPIDLEIILLDGTSIAVAGMNVVGDPVALTWRGQQTPDPECFLYILGPSDTRGERTVESIMRPDDPALHPVFGPTVVKKGEILIQSEDELPLMAGEVVTWRRSIEDEKNLVNIISGSPILVRAGENVVPLLDLDPVEASGPDNWFVRKNPRTALGTANNGRTAFIIVAEGRLENSAGLRLKELGQLCIKAGAEWAINLDGGGSSHLWTKELGLVADSCYGDGTVAGLRPLMYATGVY